VEDGHAGERGACPASDRGRGADRRGTVGAVRRPPRRGRVRAAGAPPRADGLRRVPADAPGARRRGRVPGHFPHPRPEGPGGGPAGCGQLALWGGPPGSPPVPPVDHPAEGADRSGARLPRPRAEPAFSAPGRARRGVEPPARHLPDRGRAVRPGGPDRAGGRGSDRVSRGDCLGTPVAGEGTVGQATGPARPGGVGGGGPVRHGLGTGAGGPSPVRDDSARGRRADTRSLGRHGRREADEDRRGSHSGGMCRVRHGPASGS
jgi:hypothetical protein